MGMQVVFAFLPFIGLLLGLAVGWPFLPAWAEMWFLIFICFFWCKFITFYQQQVQTKQHVTWPRLFLYLFCWFGMDAKKFLNPEIRLDKTEPGFGIWVLSCAVIGIFLIWGVPRVFNVSEYWQAWFALAGIFYLLYFTLFQWSSLILRYAGVHAAPFMQAPLLLTSLSDFWGKRWNMAFRQLMHDFFFKTVNVSHGPHLAAWLVFFVSGLFHELIFSLPARGGWGLPMLYFMIQWFGMRMEKTRWSRRYLRRKFLGRVYAFLFLILPLNLLFHEPFMTRVVIPFIRAIHSI